MPDVFDEVSEPPKDVFDEVQYSAPEDTSRETISKVFSGMGPPIRASLAQKTPVDTEGAFSPFVPIPKIQGTTLPGQVGASLANTASSLVEGLESRGGLALAPLGLGGKLVQAGMGAGFGVPAIVEGAKRVYKGTALAEPQEATEGALQVITGGAITLGGAHGLLPKSTEALLKKGEPNASEVTTPTEIHGDVRTLKEPTPELPVKESVGRVLPQTEEGIPEASKSEVALTPSEPTTIPETQGTVATQEQPIVPKVGESTPEVGAGPQIGDVEMGAAGIRELPDTGAGGEKYGIAQRVREERAQAGQVEPIEPGEGINTPDSIAIGREIIRNDPTAPERSMSAFEADPKKSISSEAMAVSRAHGEALAAGARTIEEQFGTDSPQYEAAKKALTDWDKRLKPMQTEWSKVGMAQQGFTDIDTGSFTGLERAFREYSDRDFKGTEKVQAEKISKKNRKAQADSAEAVAKVNELARNAGIEVKSPTMSEAEKRAFDAANKTVREWAIKNANQETIDRVNKAKTKQELYEIQRDAAQAARDAADKTVREWAAKKAELETKSRVAKAAKERAEAIRERAAAQRKIDEANRRHRNAILAMVKANRALRDNPLRAVWSKVREYLDRGETDPDAIRNKVARDLGMTPERVYRTMAQNERAKFLLDDMWRKKQAERRLKQSAVRWVASLDEPMLKKYLSVVPNVMFKAKVWGHAGVALGTHAPAYGFRPTYWKTFFQNYGKMFKLAASRTFYERKIADLRNNPNYAPAQRFGLNNGVETHEEFNAPALIKWASDQTGVGTRGYSVLKFLRQDIFDSIWDNLPKKDRIDEVGWVIANRINHMTGTLSDVAPPKSLQGRMKADIRPPGAASTALFAPRLLMSRAQVLFGEPTQTLGILSHWDTATPGEKMAAKMDIGSRLEITATILGLLAINAGILAANGSKQKINFDDPTKSDWLKFKGFGMDFAFGNAMLSMSRFIPRAVTTIADEKKRKAYPDEDIYTATGQFVRSQLSPFMGTVTDLGLGSDYARRPLPKKLFGFMDQNAKVPARLRREGVHPYTWGEYASQVASPIPFQEGLKEVWKEGWGMSDEQIKSYLKAIAVSTIMGTTGGRVSEDYDVKK